MSDDESVFSDSPSSTAPKSCFGAKARDFQLSEEQQVGQRQQSNYREARSHSPAVSLNSSAPSPSTQHRSEVSQTHPQEEDGRVNHIKRTKNSIKSYNSDVLLTLLLSYFEVANYC